MTQSKKVIHKLTMLLVGLLLFLTFFSNTIFSLNLPGVVVGVPERGVATRTFRSDGIIDFPESMGIHTDNTGRINFAVGRGDIISPGDVLFTLLVDTEQLLERLSAEQGRLERVLVNLARARSDLAFEESRLAGMTLGDFRPTTTQPLDLSRFDNESRRLETEIEQAEDSLATYQVLYDAGVIPQVTVAQAADRIAALRESLQRNAEERERAIQEHERVTGQAADADRLTREQQQRAFVAEQQATRHRIDGLNHTVRLLEMDEQDALNALDRLYTQAEEGGLITVYAEYHGVVREIPAGLESGMNVENNRLVMRLGLRQENNYIVTVYFPDSMGRLPTGGGNVRTVRVDVPALDEYGIRGNIYRMSAAYGRIRAEVHFSTNLRITGGERATIIVEHISSISDDMLPNSAIREDGVGYYVLVVEGERNTLLGYSFYARQHRITITDRGDRNSGVRAFPEIDLPVVVISDRPIMPGNRVRLVGDQ